MEKSNLKPFLRKNLDILFVGLNPAKGSSRNRHYFSVKQSFWNQLHGAGLITKQIDKSEADTHVFGNNSFNFSNWNYGITDLITEVAESDSSKIKPTSKDVERIIDDIIFYQPRSVILLHRKVVKPMCRKFNIIRPESNSGYLGKLNPDIDTHFFNIAFPHGNAIHDIDKISRYIEVKEHLIKRN